MAPNPPARLLLLPGLGLYGASTTKLGAPGLLIDSLPEMMDQKKSKLFVYHSNLLPSTKNRKSRNSGSELNKKETNTGCKREKAHTVKHIPVGRKLATIALGHVAIKRYEVPEFKTPGA